MKVKTKAYAKINLLLDIEGLRTDGYHELFMIMQSVSAADTVTVEKVRGGGIGVTCNVEGIPCDESNIVYKCAREFFRYNRITRYGINIDINKRIPHAAGLAGGSADGAGTLVALNELYGTELSADELCEIGLKVGSDIPFCIVGGTKLAQGRGEVLSKVKPLRKCYIVLAKPEISVSTGKAYAAFDEFGKSRTPDKLGMLCAVQSRDLRAVCDKLDNVFEQFIEVPARVDIKQVMRDNGALGACMSGSGPTVFGIFENKDDAENAAAELKTFVKDVLVTTPVSKGVKICK
ncbi:MAG: 4-(cytidine 5'-diphospho)-2-C-methyl-D-erythritol kinase [Eubacterium sp.]|nr:4-(cytidine 5'-diphospho)-2-C-methyl-D-erythritol kinase [Eubacterium sp.]